MRGAPPHKHLESTTLPGASLLHHMVLGDPRGDWLNDIQTVDSKIVAFHLSKYWVCRKKREKFCERLAKPQKRYSDSFIKKSNGNVSGLFFSPKSGSQRKHKLTNTKGSWLVSTARSRSGYEAETLSTPSHFPSRTRFHWGRFYCCRGGEVVVFRREANLS